jgi:uncharacterized protein with FMN-binding domain
VSESRSNKKVANGLVALSSAAVLAVYAAGYQRTRTAADRFAVQAEGRRTALPAPPVAAVPVMPAPAPPPASSRETVKRSVPAGQPRVEGTIRPPVARVPAKKAAPPEVAAPPVAIPAPAPVPVVEPPPPAIVPPEPAPVPAKPHYKNGTYLGWGTSRHGDIQASVVVEDGRILSATIAQCLTRYSCNVIDRLPPQVAQRQSPETDYVSGATQSTNAFYYAVVDALSKAK